MKNELMWTFFMELSGHIMADENAPLPDVWYPKTVYNKNIKCDSDTWDEVVDFISENGFNTCVIDIADGIKYETHPDISAPDAWSKDLLKAKLEIMRKKGIEPIPKLNFSMTHSTWMKHYRRYVSTPEYYKVCSDLISEVCELFGNPRLFHLGMDEETIWDQNSREICIVRHEKLWWHDLYFLLGEVEKQGVRPWLWADYFWAHPESFAEKMPKSVLLSNWFYTPLKNYTDYHKPRAEAYEKLDALGYEQIPCGSLWAGVVNNPYELMMHGKTKLDPALVKGYMIIPWVYEINSKTIHSIKHNALTFKLAREEVYPESLAK